MLQKTLAALLAVVLAAVLLFVGLSYSLYYADLEELPANWGPTKTTYPEIMRQEYWALYGSGGDPHIEPVSPPGLVFWFAWDATFDVSNDHDLDILIDAGTSQRKINVARIVKASHWSTGQFLDTALDRSQVGPGVVGVRAAAMAYFGKAPETLSPAQRDALMHGMLMQGFLDPWCEPMSYMKYHTPEEIEAAKASLLPPPAGHACPTPRN